jgi:hypothetical protein
MSIENLGKYLSGTFLKSFFLVFVTNLTMILYLFVVSQKMNKLNSLGNRIRMIFIHLIELSFAESKALFKETYCSIGIFNALYELIYLIIFIFSYFNLQYTLLLFLLILKLLLKLEIILD